LIEKENHITHREDRRELFSVNDTGIIVWFTVPKGKVAYLVFLMVKGATDVNSYIKNYTDQVKIVRINTNMVAHIPEGLLIGRAGDSIRYLVGNADNYMTALVVLEPIRKTPPDRELKGK